MKPIAAPSTSRLLAAAFGLFVVLGGVSVAMGANTVSGTVYDKYGTPLADIDVELLDQYRRLLPSGRQRTPSSGRYEFSGLTDGYYYIRVYAFRYDLVDDERMVQFASISARPGESGSSFNLEDFYLQPKRGGLRDAGLGVVFAQDIPKDAEKLYKKAVSDLQNKKTDAGFAGLQQAIESFPKYYNALFRYGQELLIRKQYSAAAVVFMRAAEVNPKNAMPFYLAGFALFELGGKYLKNAQIALEQAAKMAPASSAVMLQLGKTERKLGQFAEAEKHLLAAKKNSPVKSPEIQKELSQLYANDLKKYKEAADELEQYLKSAKLSDDDAAKLKQTIASLRTKANSQTATN